MADEKKEQPQMEACKGPSGYMFILGMMLLVFIMFGGLGDNIASISGIVLDPLIGFNGEFPLLTMMCAGLITIIVSTVTRHFMADWVDMAKKQKTMNEFNKQLREATKKGDEKRTQKLNEQNQEILAMQSSMMMSQMKSSVITMVVAILIFRWLAFHLNTIDHPVITTPWEMHWPLMETAFKKVCGTICNPTGSGSRGGMPYWIFIYILITIPIGQALMRGLKYFEFSRKLKDAGHDVFGVQPPKKPKEAPEAPLPDKPSSKKKKDKKKEETPKEKAQREREELRRR